jgi:hypothetical protein
MGPVVIVGLSTGPIPWPIGVSTLGRKRKGLVVFAGLAEALARESGRAVAHWWGVSNNTVWKWRQALGIAGQRTEGTRRLRRERAQSPASLAARKRLHEREQGPALDQPSATRS